MLPWKPDYRTVPPLGIIQSAVVMTSVVAIRKESQPLRVTVVDNNTLRPGPCFNLSNGRAWNWEPFPGACLVARTLLRPMS